MGLPSTRPALAIRGYTIILRDLVLFECNRLIHVLADGGHGTKFLAAMPKLAVEESSFHVALVH